MSTASIVEKLIDVNGQTIMIYNRTLEKDSDGNIISETYSTPIRTLSWVMAFGGMIETYELYGYHVDGEYSACVHATVPVGIGDRVVLSDGTELYVNEIIKHYELDSVAYLELILKRTGGLKID